LRLLKGFHMTYQRHSCELVETHTEQYRVASKKAVLGVHFPLFQNVTGRPSPPLHLLWTMLGAVAI
jgi:hypothetical protein